MVERINTNVFSQLFSIGNETNKKIWLFCNVTFVVQYFLYVLTFTFKYNNICNKINCLYLTVAYGLSIIQYAKNGGDFIKNPSCLSVIFFMTFPTNFYLLPYFLFSLYHLIAQAYKFFCFETTKADRNKRIIKIQKYQVHPFIKKNLTWLYLRKEIVGDSAIYALFITVFIALIRFNLKSFCFLLLILRQQFHSSDSAERATLRFFKFLDKNVDKMPSVLQTAYLSMKKMSNNPKINKQLIAKQIKKDLEKDVKHTNYEKIKKD